MELLVLDVHALDRPDAARKVEHYGLVEVRRDVPAAIGLPDHPRMSWHTSCYMVDPDYGFTTFGPIGGVFVIGVGRLALGVLLMIACAVRLRAFFRGETLSEDTPILVPDTAELPAALSESAQRKCALEAP
jgi:hypothetical protein